MSSANVEFIREMLETFNRGERERSIDYLHDEVELEQWPAMPDSDVYVGKEEWLRGLRLWLDEFEHEVRDGRLRRCRVFRDETEARRAAGIED